MNPSNQHHDVAAKAQPLLPGKVSSAQTSADFIASQMARIAGAGDRLISPRPQPVPTPAISGSVGQPPQSLESQLDKLNETLSYIEHIAGALASKFEEAI